MNNETTLTDRINAILSRYPLATKMMIDDAKENAEQTCEGDDELFIEYFEAGLESFILNA